MAIRLRLIGNTWIALCAAETEEKSGDVYLDDNMHHALTTKFSLDFNSNKIWETIDGEDFIPFDSYLKYLMDKEELV